MSDTQTLTAAQLELIPQVKAAAAKAGAIVLSEEIVRMYANDPAPDWIFRCKSADGKSSNWISVDHAGKIRRGAL